MKKFHSFHYYLLSTFHESVSHVGAGDIPMNKTKIPTLVKFSFHWEWRGGSGRQIINQINK